MGSSLSYTSKLRTEVFLSPLIFSFLSFLSFLEVQNGFETVVVLEAHVRFDCRISLGLRYSSN